MIVQRKTISSEFNVVICFTGPFYKSSPVSSIVLETRNAAVFPPYRFVHLRLVYTSDVVGVRIGVLRPSENRQSEVVSRVISSTESVSEESERFHFFQCR